MTRQDVDKHIAAAQKTDERRAAAATAAGETAPLPAATIVTIATHGLAYVQSLVCPVFAVRLRSGEGRRIVDEVKASMQAWDDQ